MVSIELLDHDAIGRAFDIENGAHASEEFASVPAHLLGDLIESVKRAGLKRREDRLASPRWT